MLHIKSSDGVTIKSVQYDALLQALTLCVRENQRSIPDCCQSFVVWFFCKG